LGLMVQKHQPQTVCRSCGRDVPLEGSSGAKVLFLRMMDGWGGGSSVVEVFQQLIQ
jgi:hypothetical protein